MKRVPFALKISLTTMASIGMCYNAWRNNLYDPDLYRLAIKYRHKYDDNCVKSNDIFEVNKI